MNLSEINEKNIVNSERPTWDDYFLSIADSVSNRAHVIEEKADVLWSVTSRSLLLDL